MSINYGLYTMIQPIPQTFSMTSKQTKANDGTPPQGHVEKQGYHACHQCPDTSCEVLRAQMYSFVYNIQRGRIEYPTREAK